MNQEENMVGSNSPQNMSECSEIGDLVIDESLELKLEGDKDEESVDKTINSSNNKRIEDSNLYLPELIEEDTSTGFKITSIKSIPAVSFNTEKPPSKDQPNITTDINIESHSKEIERNNLTNPRENISTALNLIGQNQTNTETNICVPSDNVNDNKRVHDNSESFDLPAKQIKLDTPNNSPSPSTSSQAMQQATSSVGGVQKSSTNRRKSLLKPREDDMIFDEVSTIYPINKKPTMENPNKAIMKKVALVRVCADFMLKELGKKSLFMKKKKLSLQKLIEGFNSQF